MVTRSVIDLQTPVFDQRTGHLRSHIEWANTIARKVRADLRFVAGSAEEELLESEAQFELVRKLADFDPARVPDGGDVDMAFRGFAKKFIRCACERESHRLRNAGTYHTTRTPEAVRVGGIVPESASAREEERRLPAEGMFQEFGDVRCRLYEQELVVESDPDPDTWATAIVHADRKAAGWLWWLGDLTRYGYKRYGRKAARARLVARGAASSSVRTARRVCEMFQNDNRLSFLGFSHHLAVSTLPLKDALALLWRAKRERLSRKDLEDIVRAQRGATSRPAFVITRKQRERLATVAAEFGWEEERALAFLSRLNGAA